jgi:tRNA (guanine37-N1)-methyltransferase
MLIEKLVKCFANKLKALVSLHKQTSLPTAPTTIPPTTIPKIKMKFPFDPSLKEMKQLNRDLFKLNINVPMIKVRKFDYGRVKRILGAYTFEAVNKKHQDLDQSDALYSTHKYMLLDPDLFGYSKLDAKVKEDLTSVMREDKSQTIADDFSIESLLETKPIQVTYEDLKFDDVMRAILPDTLLNENIKVKSYSVIGHIAHFNLRDQVLDYKHIIGKEE